MLEFILVHQMLLIITCSHVKAYSDNYTLNFPRSKPIYRGQRDIALVELPNPLLPQEVITLP